MPEPNDAASLLRALSRGLDEREPMEEGPARDAHDRGLLSVVGRLRAQLQETLLEEAADAAPRSVNAAYACALFSQPHLGGLLGDANVSGTPGLALEPLHAADAPLVLAPDAVRDVLRLRDWEIDDLREEIDCRIGQLLKQQRAMHWLWDRFDLGSGRVEPLLRALFPGAPARLPQVGFARGGAQLYAVLQQRRPVPTSALHLPWVIPPDQAWGPMGGFDARMVDEGLRSALGRSVGADPTEVLVLLDAMVTVIPRSAHDAFLAHDAWRIRGLGAMTTLGATYRDGTWLRRALGPADVEVGPWLLPDHGQDHVDVVTAFDRLALPRVATMMRHLHAELLARLYRERPTESAAPAPEDIEVYHLRWHIQQVLQPLLDWTESATTVRYVSAKLGKPEPETRALLADAGRQWRERADRFWWGAPSRSQPHTVRAALTLHVLCTHDTLRQAHRRPDRWVYPFRDLLLLFSAHWFAEGNLVPLVVQGDHEAWRADPVARWFWGLWSDLLDTIETDVTTWSGSHALD